jgi:vacuolar-type H+-ATPase subunit I/STV1
VNDHDTGIYEKPGHSSYLQTFDQFIDHDGNDSENRTVEGNQMNNQIEKQEKSLGELQAKIREYQNIILKYETFFREEITLFRLQKTKLTTMQEAFQNQELFTKEIEQHISLYITEQSHQENKYTSFKRIILRFFHQNRFNQSCAHLKISEIEENISKKQRILENLQTEVQNWKQNRMVRLSPTESSQIALN